MTRPPKLSNTAENNGGSADAPQRRQSPPALAPRRGIHQGPFQECWAERAESEGHSGERVGMALEGGAGGAFLLGSHGGVELDLADNFVEPHTLRSLTIYLVKKSFRNTAGP